VSAVTESYIEGLHKYALNQWASYCAQPGEENRLGDGLFKNALYFFEILHNLELNESIETSIANWCFVLELIVILENELDKSQLQRSSSKPLPQRERSIGITVDMIERVAVACELKSLELLMNRASDIRYTRACVGAAAGNEDDTNNII